jgi:hypothetical protein
VPAVIAVIAQGVGVQLAGAVNKLVSVKVQAASAEKAAVTSTAKPSEVKPVKVSV